MPAYIVLGTYTEEGYEKLREMPEKIRKHRTEWEQMGVRLLGAWMTMGDYDFVSIYEAPDDLTMATSLLLTGEANLVRTSTMRAFSEDEFAQIISRLP